MKILSILICTVMVTSLFGAIAQNVGEPGPSSNGTENFFLSNISASNPQIIGQSSPNSSGSGGLANSPWPMFRQNLNHTGVSPYDTSTNNGQIKWSFETGDDVYSSPTIGSDGTIYVGSSDNKLYAINPDGTEKWSFITGWSVISTTAIGFDNTIYIGSTDNNIYAINPVGTLKWSLPYGFNSSPAIGSNGTIYVGALGRGLCAINPDGNLKWTFTSSMQSSPAIGSDGTIYVGSDEKKLYAINPDGSEKWNFTTLDQVTSSPAIGSDGTIFIGSRDNNLYAIDPNGTQKWNFTTGHNVESSPATDLNGTIYIGSHDGNLYAINPNGTEKWSFTTGGVVKSSPAIGSDGTIYVGSNNNKLYAINPDGTEKWNFMTSGWVSSSPAIGSDGTIYVGSYDNKLYAFGNPNIPPFADAGPGQTVNEGDVVHFDGSGSYAPNGTIESYKWDFDSDVDSDGDGDPTNDVDATGPTPIHIYGDDGMFVVTLRVTDDDDLNGTDICNVTVFNVDPTVTIKSAIMEVEIGLRVAGRKFNDVGMTLYEGGTPIGYASIERMPGSPNDQMAWIPITLDMTKSYSATVTYLPEDPPNVGANPVWIYIKFENGSIEEIHHTFNVQQSMKRNSDHWNHVEPWEVDLNAHLIGCQFEIATHTTDPGSDDETLTFTYDSQVETFTYLNNPPGPDPYPSPEVNPKDIVTTTTLVYEGSGTITLIVKDDDNFRLGIGQGTVFIIMI